MRSKDNRLITGQSFDCWSYVSNNENQTIIPSEMTFIVMSITTTLKKYSTRSREEGEMLETNSGS